MKELEFKKWLINESSDPQIDQAIYNAVKTWDIQRQIDHNNKSISRTGQRSELEDKYYDGQTGQMIRPLPQNLQKAAYALGEMIAKIKSDKSFPKAYHQVITYHKDAQGQPVLDEDGEPKYDITKNDGPSPHSRGNFVKNPDGTETGYTQYDKGMDHVLDVISNKFGLNQEGENLMYYVMKNLKFG